MPSPSKEDLVLQLFLENSPLKEWHFSEVVKEAKVTRAIANKWLKKYVAEGMLRYVKEKGKFPYFTVGSNNVTYYSSKRMYALQQLYHSGLIPSLLALSSAKTVIIFGSMVKGDWYKDSDVDVFILGDASGFNKSVFEKRLGKHIELHVFADKKEVRAVKTGLIKNVVNGYVVKGELQDVVEVSP